MSNTKASRQAVFAAADGLRAKGVEPTIQGVIDLIGGSNSTVGPHLAAWKEKSCPPPRPVPESVTIRSSILVEAVWRAALDELQAEIEQARRATSDGIAEAERTLASSMAISQALETARDALLDQVESLKSDCLEARLALRQVDELKQALAQEKQCSEIYRQEGEELKRVNASLKGEVASLKEQGGLLLARLSPRPRPHSAPRREGKAA